ncbi:MAG: ATP-binding protein [Pseudobacter sp.]|uniref:sensor histidine kinase n=1 Tax=Pseudobacter sp. TaxID=2045420 RepID=UPI003F7E5C08
MKQLFSLLLLFCMLPLASFCQEQGNDSLLTALKAHKEDTNKVRTLYRLAMNYEKSNLDSATLMLKKLRELSSTLKYNLGLYLYYERATVVSFTNGDFEQALKESKEGLEMAKKLKNTGYEAVMLNNIAICYGYMDKFQEQLDYTLQAKDKVEMSKDSAKLSGLYHGLSNVYSSLGQNRKSLDYALLSIRLYSEFGKRNDYINRVYAAAAQTYEVMGITDSADIYFTKAISESKRLNDKFAEGTIYKYAANFYSNTGNYDKMLEMAKQSLPLAKELNSRQLEASSYYNLAAANFYNNNNAAAYRNVKLALEIAEKDSIKQQAQDSYRLLSYIAARDGDFRTSTMARGKADSLREAALNEEVALNAADLEKKYETEKKENQIKLHEATIRQKNTLNYVLISGAVALLIILILSYLNYRNKQKLQQQRISELETEKQLLATQSLLKGQEDERSRLAKDLHDGLGGLLSGVKLQLGAMKGNLILTEENGRAFNNALNKLDESISEMRRVAHNMMPEALLNMGLKQALQDFCDGLAESQSFSITCEFYGLEQRMAPSVEIVLYRIIQELMNNAIKHSGASIILAQVIRQQDHVTITIEDNGKGFDTANLENMRTAGLRNIRSRVNYLHGSMDIKAAPGKGTSIHIDCIIDEHEQNR